MIIRSPPYVDPAHQHAYVAALLARVEPVQVLHFLFAQRDFQLVVRLNVVRVGRHWDDREVLRVLLQVPLQDDLSDRFLVLSVHLRDFLVLQQLLHGGLTLVGASQRGVGYYLNALREAELYQIFILKEGVDLDLVAQRLYGARDQHLLHFGDAEVAHPNVLRQALADQGFNRLPGVAHVIPALQPDLAASEREA